MSIPPDLLHEIDRELRASCRSIENGAFRLAQLVELHRRATESSLRRGRTASVVDLFADTPAAEEPHLTKLVNALRGDR